MKRFPLTIVATACFPLLVTGCPDDTMMDDEAGDTDTSTDDATEDGSTTTTTDDEADVTTTMDDTTTDDTTTDDTTTDDTTTDDTTEETGGVCGDMTIDGNEQCEGADLGGQTCVDVGFAGGELICGADCQFDTSGCFAEGCGNDILEGLEGCDGADLGGQTCVSLGFGGGELFCDPDCKLVADECITCGNDVIDDPEQCDGSDFGGISCADFGFNAGELICSDDCTSTDSSGCNNDLVFCNANAVAILDNDPNGSTSSVVVPDVGTVANVRVSVDISHTWLADLEVSLDRDGMMTTFMFRDIADIGDTPDTCSGADMIATLDDAAMGSIQDQACVIDNFPAVDGTYQPEQVLSAFDGGSIAGTWNLHVVDDANQDFGNVNQFCVYITPQ